MSLLKYPPESPAQRLVLEVAFLVPIIIGVASFGQLAKTDVTFTIVLSIIFCINICLRFYVINEAKDWIFFLIGVLGGGGNDLTSMINGVYDYTSLTVLPFLNGLMPLWSVFFWGQVFLLFRKIFHLEWFKGPTFAKDGKYLKGWVDTRLLVDIVLLILLRIAIYNTYLLDAWVPAIIYVVGIGIRLIIFRPQKHEVLLIGILPYAFMFEGLMVSFGLYEYHNPVFLGLPGWLMLWWIFLVPLVIKEVFDRLEYYLKK